MTILDLIATNQFSLILLTLVVGLLIGSFLNVVIYRLPIMLQRDWEQQCHEFLESAEPVPASGGSDGAHQTFNLIKPDSHCPQCNQKVRPWQNIPVVSYLLLGGKCAACKHPISLRYPVIEVATALLSALVAWQFGFTWLTLALLILTWSLISLTVIDLDHQLLPDNITLPLLWLGLLVNTADLGFEVSARDAVIGAVAGYLVFWAFYWAFKLLTGKEGMGYGDFKLLAALGAWMGWQSLLPIIILSSLVGAVTGLCLLLFLGRDRNIPIPFGPYLAGAGFIMLIWGEGLSRFYMETFVL